MKQYLELLDKVWSEGVRKQNRTGIDTLSVFGTSMRFDLSEGFPIITTKKIHIKSIIHELLWFISGNTNIKYLHDNGITIWDEWADENGDLGPVYGHQWVHWDTKSGYINQLAEAIQKLKKSPDSRRIIISAWNPADVPKMALPPCHLMYHFNTRPMSLEERLDVAREKLMLKQIQECNLRSDSQREVVMSLMDRNDIPSRYLDCLLYQRSVDVGLGLGFNISSYSLLTMMVAQCVNMIPGEFVWTGGDTHIYVNHIDALQEQAKRKPFPLPTMKINQDIKNIDDFEYNDFVLENYRHHPLIKMRVAV